jgi:DNA-binding Lrp family transcriptional regulator
MNRKVRAYVLVNANLGKEDELLLELMALPGVVRAWVVYGVYDVVLEIEAEGSASSLGWSDRLLRIGGFYSGPNRR